jgi:hypothetical protein
VQSASRRERSDASNSECGLRIAGRKRRPGGEEPDEEPGTLVFQADCVDGGAHRLWDFDQLTHVAQKGWGSGFRVFDEYAYATLAASQA